MISNTKPVCQDITSTPVFYIRNRTIATSVQYPDIVVVRDDKSRNFKIIGPKIFDTVDLSTKDIFVEFNNAAGEFNQTEITEKTIKDNTLEFIWKVPEEALKYTGEMQFDVLFSSDDYKWHTKPCKVKVEAGLPVTSSTYGVSPSVYEQWKLEAASNLEEIKKLKNEIEALVNSKKQ